MNNVINERTYCEVARVLKARKDVAQKIPANIINYIYNYDGYESINKLNYMDTDILNKISTEALCLYTFLYTKYVANSEEKEKIKKILRDNERAYQEELRIKYSPDSIFSDRNKREPVDNMKLEEDVSASLVEYKPSIFSKIKKWLSRLIRR